MVQRDPLRDVLLSLLANVAAWAAGVFLAYSAHDPDPEYMEASVELKQARRISQRLKAAPDPAAARGIPAHCTCSPSTEFSLHRSGRAAARIAAADRYR